MRSSGPAGRTCCTALSAVGHRLPRKEGDDPEPGTRFGRLEGRPGVADRAVPLPYTMSCSSLLSLDRQADERWRSCGPRATHPWHLTESCSGRRPAAREEAVVLAPRPRGTPSRRRGPPLQVGLNGPRGTCPSRLSGRPPPPPRPRGAPSARSGFRRERPYPGGLEPRPLHSPADDHRRHHDLDARALGVARARGAAPPPPTPTRAALSKR